MNIAAQKPAVVSDTQPAPDLKTLKIGALLNASSGTCNKEAEAELVGILEAAGLKAAHLWCGECSGYQTALDETRAMDLDLLIVLGGDGTIRSAAEGCDAERPILVPLPGGTMNVLPKALYGERPWAQALKATLDRPVLRPVAGAKVQQHRFFVAAMFGGVAGMGEAREALRTLAIGEAVEKGMAAMQGVMSSTLNYDFEGRTGQSEAIAVMCGASRLADGSASGFEAAAMKVENPFSVMRLALHSLFGGWRQDPDVVHAYLHRLKVRSDTAITAMLDGETFDLGLEAEVEHLPHAFTALVPADD